jgi:hypothetical protein
MIQESPSQKPGTSAIQILYYTTGSQLPENPGCLPGSICFDCVTALSTPCYANYKIFVHFLASQEMFCSMTLESCFCTCGLGLA